MTNKLYPHFIKDTERTVAVRKVSPRLIKEVVDLHKAPSVPLNTVTYPDGHTEQEENAADPDYLRKVQEHNGIVSIAINDMLIDQGVVVELTADDIEEVKRLRAYWLEKYQKELAGNDKFIFINYICIGTPEDLKELLSAIARRTSATPEGTQQVLDTFQS